MRSLILGGGTFVGRRMVDLLISQGHDVTVLNRGKTSGEIATILGLSKRTVDFHIDNARQKLGVATRIEAVVKASSAGIIKL